ncbi:short-chain dehydrogenase [Cordyceps javanica]|uniref:Short-chain dehydrogenase n=1 Tax=Cordyceps javanica TaxID=43265 RepID=A0A545UN71_9HYPO|nr:short-chain dehydrogenase [Cordyceps javanica]TQW02663.1 short-chain dehydrogenase [Cordyceps javanica]
MPPPPRPSFGLVRRILSQVCAAIAGRRAQSQLIAIHDDDESNPKAKAQKNPSLFKYWVLELICFFLAAAAVLVIHVILWRYNHRPVPDWPYGLSVNTLLSILSTVLRACLLAVLASIMGQAKWTWLHGGPRPIDDLQTFDQASRGLFGALLIIKLLAQRFSQSFVPLLSVIVIIFSVAIGPFVQQAVATVICDKPGSFGEASLPYAQNLPGKDGYFRTGAGLWEPGKGLQSAFLTSLTEPGRKNTKLQFECDTGNCTFPVTNGVTHSTLAMCSRCVDVSTQITRRQHSGSFDSYFMGPLEVFHSKGFQNGTKLAVGPAYNVTIPPDLLQISGSSVANITMLSLSPYVDQTGNLSRPNAALCIMYFCRQDIEPAVQRSELTEKVVSTTLVPIVVQDEPQDFAYHDRLLAKSPCLVNGKAYTAANFSSLKSQPNDRTFRTLTIDNQTVEVPSYCVYSVGPYYATSISQWLQRMLFNGHCSTLSSAQTSVVQCDDKFWLANLFDPVNTTFAYHNHLFEELAASVTVFLRMDGIGPLNYSSDASRPEGSKGQIKGTAVQKTACLVVHWEWLLYSSILCFLTTIVFFATLISSHRLRNHVPIWKSSLLPLLCLDIQPDKEAPNQRILNTQRQDLDQIETAAKSTCISLETNAEDVELLPVSETDVVDESPTRSAFVSIPTRSSEDLGSYSPPVRIRPSALNTRGNL